MLRSSLDGARAGGDYACALSAAGGADRDGLVDGLVGRPLLRRALVRLGDGDELLDARELLDLALRQARDVAVDADQGDLGADELPGLVAQTVKLPLDRGDLVLGRVRPHLDEHGLLVSFATFVGGALLQ